MVYAPVTLMTILHRYKMHLLEIAGAVYWRLPNPIRVLLWTVWRCVYDGVKTKSAVVFLSSFWRSFFWSTTYKVCFRLVLHDVIKRKASPGQNAQNKRESEESREQKRA
jgi:hypothetical protein